MKKRRKFIAGCLIFTLLVGLIQTIYSAEMYQAATSYTNAKEFYESSALNGESYHAKAAYGRVYYATKAKLASSSTNTKYYTVGFDVMLSGNGHSVSFTVQREGGSMTQVDSQKDGTYEYILYTITEDKLFDLATKANSSNAAYVLSASTISVRMDAIMTTKEGSKIKGDITEDGRGGFTHWGTIYRLKDSSDLKKMKEIFSGHAFESYKEIYEKLDNYLLQVRYNVLGLNPTGNDPTLSNSSYTYNSDGILQKGNSTYIDSSRTVNKITLLSTGTIGLAKTGYHLPSGKEWVTNGKRYFASNSTHQSTSVDPEVSYKNHGLTLYANWKANSYTVIYNANGGYGSVAPSAMVYDTTGRLRTNTFQRTGYYIPTGKEWIDANGNTYSSSTPVKNLTSEDGGNVILYANWEPVVVSLNFDKQTGSGGTDFIFEKYNTGFYSESTCNNWIFSILTPNKLGYDFIGYYAGINSGGTQFVNQNGAIAIPNTFLVKNTPAYADWKPKQFKLTFDMQGGKNGTSTAIATYEQLYPEAEAPKRTGYSFKGYYTQKNGKGELVYNEYMATEKNYLAVMDTTLYAYWLDDVPPKIVLNVSNDQWTNKSVTLLAEASDNGSGLKSVVIYEIKTDGSLSKVAEQNNLNGVKSKSVSFNNTKEGIIRYKAVATDMAENTTESYNTVYFDTTAPTGEVVSVSVNGTTFYFDIDITDINTGN